MPNTKSAKKRLRQNVRRRAHNRTIRSAMRTQMRKVRERLEAEDAAGAEAELRVATKKLDQAAAKNVIHKNAAARLKSRLARRLNALQASASTA
jgi:small subunit ribosomal protein S20